MTVTNTSARRPAPPGGARLAAVRRPGRIGPLAVGQLVLLEVAVLAVLAVRGRSPILLGAVGAVALVLVVLVLARRQRLWWFEYRRVRKGLRRRAQASAKVATHLPPLVQMAPDLKIVQAQDRGSRFGVGQDAAGWFVALEVTASAGTAPEAVPGLTVALIAQVLTETTVPVSAVQVVGHVVPASAPALPRSAPCLVSYQELTSGVAVPSQARVWIGVRLSAADARRASASRGGGPHGVHRALAAVSGRIVKVLSAADLDAVPLTAPDLLSVMMTTAGLGDNRAAQEGNQPAVREEWTGFHVPGAVHVGFEIADLDVTAVSAALRLLPRLPVATTVAVVLAGRADADVTVQAVVDVLALPQAVDQTVQSSVDLFRSGGVPLRRLDGRHAAAVYACAPNGATI